MIIMYSSAIIVECWSALCSHNARQALSSSTVRACHSSLSQVVTVAASSICVVFGAYSGLAVSFRQLGASVENFQVAMIRKEPMALFAGRLTDHAELCHVLQSLRHSWSRERELFGCR